MTGRNLNDVSFLSNSDDTFVRKLAESNRNVSAQDVEVEEHHYLGNKKEDGEIGTFGAEKYFNGCVDKDSPRLTSIILKHLQPKKDGQLNDYMVPMKPNIHPETPSINSESTWNSQSALLQSVQRKTSEAKTNKVHGKNFLAVLGCKCSCSDKDSIDVEDDDDDEHIGEISFKRSSNAPMLQGKAISEEFTKGSLEMINHTQDHRSRRRMSIAKIWRNWELE
ncbi:protein PHYTOCHROME KINASE SUBSTRATE 1-like [Manihot esculenta]|uniref:protein PHYTOCHROME KINASE SUBSTRATE 1-like n=1 Tax=Manihot esculenta TaxID=3983 RepID=UPI001CC78356|nr:protein PHYTOCHROME KINASE SUBSTRATE 1-like [Manihot esculenta]